MREISSTMVEVKLSDGNEDKHVLVHDGTQVVALVAPGGRMAAPKQHTMLVGTRDELEAEVARLKLKAPRPKPDRRPTATREEKV